MPYIKINPDNTVTIGGGVATPEMVNSGWFMYTGTIPVASVYRWDNVNQVVVPDYTKDKEAKLKVIEEAYNAAMAKLTEPYPERETATWTQQLYEARSYLADPTSPTPLIDAIVRGRQSSPLSAIDKDTLVSKIIEKANQYALAVGLLTGERHRCEAEILSATNIAEIEAVQWKNPLDPTDTIVDEPSDPPPADDSLPSTPPPDI